MGSFVLNTYRKGGRQTETSVLKLYKACGISAITYSRLYPGLSAIPDDIIDEIHYLKFAATRRPLTKRGKEKETDD
jgi:hypothetical protein